MPPAFSLRTAIVIIGVVLVAFKKKKNYQNFKGARSKGMGVRACVLQAQGSLKKHHLCL